MSVKIRSRAISGRKTKWFGQITKENESVATNGNFNVQIIVTTVGKCFNLKKKMKVIVTVLEVFCGKNVLLNLT